MKFYYPKDANGNVIGFKTPESQVYDKNNTSLTTKLNNIDNDVVEVKANINPNLNLIASVLVEKYDAESVLQRNGNPQSLFLIEHGLYGVISTNIRLFEIVCVELDINNRISD